MTESSLSRLAGNIYVVNASWLITERLVRLFISAMVGIFVARYLGSQNFGSLAFAQSYIAIFSVAATLGLDSIIVRELVRSPENQSEILGSAFFLRLAVTFILLICLAVSLSLIKLSVTETLLVFVIGSGLIFQSFLVIDPYFQSRVQSKFVARAQLTQLALLSSIKIGLILMEAELIWFAVAIALGNAFLAGGLYLAYRNTGARLGLWRLHWPSARTLLANSAPILAAELFALALMISDKIMIKFMLGNKPLGWYAAATMIAATWYFIPIALGSTFNPYIIKHVQNWSRDTGIRVLFSSLFIITVIGTVLTYFLAPTVIAVLFGSDYQPAAPLLTVLILNGIFVFHVSVRSKVLVAMKRQGVTTLLILFALVVNIVGNLLLIPKFGVQGAAWSSVIAWGTSVVVFPLMFAVSRPFVGFFVRPRLIGLRNMIDSLKS